MTDRSVTQGDALPSAMALVHQRIEQRQHIGAQVYVSLAGTAVADVAVGEARPGVPMDRDTLMLWLSSGKPLTACLIARLWERGLIHLDQPVQQYLAEFANGKEAVTIRHLLTHTGGFRPRTFREVGDGWDTIINAICAQPLEPGWIPGQKAGYHTATSWYILGEVARRVTNADSFVSLFRAEVAEPLGLQDTWIGMPRQAYESYGNRMGVLQSTETGRLLAFRSDRSPEAACEPSPGGNARGPIRELGRFYEALLAGGKGWLQPQTVAALTARHRVGMYDETFQTVLDWGLGIIPNSAYLKLDGDLPYQYGKHASMRAYGHGGSQTSVGFADPHYQLVVAAVFNGACGEVAHQKRAKAFLEALYQDLHLAGADTGHDQTVWQ